MTTFQEYQIIPRRFRPKRFSEVTGHEAIVTTLKNALMHKRLGQAYLFCGMRGCGKTTLARLFAKALNCLKRDADSEPCNQCVSCREISEGCSLDVVEIDGASNRGIDDIRNLTETVDYAPQSSLFKIYIIDEVHMLTKEAFNALLKTLEEPPQRVKFFFATTESHRLPPTITSRCQRFNLGRLSEKQLVEKLSRVAAELSVSIEEGALLQIGQLADGSLRDAESLLDQLICFGKAPITLELTREIFGLLSTSHLAKLDEAIAEDDSEKAMAIGKELHTSGRDISAVTESLLHHFRDHLLKPTRFDKQQCLNILDTLITWQQQIAKTPFKQVHLEMLCAALVRSAKRITLDQLIERLLKLEGADDGRRREQTETEVKVEDSEPEAQPHNQKQHPAYQYETLIRFAAVELEGSIKNG